MHLKNHLHHGIPNNHMIQLGAVIDLELCRMEWNTFYFELDWLLKFVQAFITEVAISNSYGFI